MKRAQLRQFEEQVVTFIDERHRALGVEESGLLPYYVQRAEKKRAFTRYERGLLAHLETGTTIYHAGIGIGVLSAALALKGCRVIGFEEMPERAEAARALRDAVAQGTDYELREANFPGGLRADEPAGAATLLFTNVAGNWSDETYAGAFAAMKRFSRTILDLRLFGHTRNEPEERDELARRLEAMGHELRPLDLNCNNNFYVELTAR
ncbi:hypothetical protein [Sphingomicrobium nitratireducens]|uniref:hypothetical protein n=1 Tax=Sphingomicrobium nitratireducens TaxID=2964666 RepID=UPI002240C3D7|nr:hypothetical protein [Sphingomicrobium nitratireducens]